MSGAAAPLQLQMHVCHACGDKVEVAMRVAVQIDTAKPLKAETCAKCGRKLAALVMSLFKHQPKKAAK